MTKKPIRKPINVDIKIHKEIKELAFIEDIPIIELTRKMVKKYKETTLPLSIYKETHEKLLKLKDQLNMNIIDMLQEMVDGNKIIAEEIRLFNEYSKKMTNEQLKIIIFSNKIKIIK